jgi:competence ComEA-like helix-hairpin-helix protein
MWEIRIIFKINKKKGYYAKIENGFNFGSGCFFDCQLCSARHGINTATKKELVTLNGVGKKKADRIIEYREEHPFEKIEDLKNVQGISQKTLDKNKDLITVKDE